MASVTLLADFILSLSITDTNFDIHYVLGTNNVPLSSPPLVNIPTASSPLYTGPLAITMLFHNLGGGSIPISWGNEVRQNAILMVFEPTNGYASLTNPPSLVTRVG